MLYNCRRGLEDVQKKIEALDDGLKFMDRQQIRDKLSEESDIHRTNVLGRRLRLLNKAVELQLNISRLIYLDEKDSIRAQSGILEAKTSDGAISIPETNATLVDILGGELTYETAGKSSNSSQGQKEILELSDYLSRPALIYSTSIAVGSGLDTSLSVWDLFTLLPSVRAKIRNYAYLRANMKVRISVSGTPFHSGRMLISYQPYAFVNQNLINLVLNKTAVAAYRPCLINYLSQARGSVVMNLNENKPVEVTIPYISTKPMHRLFTTNVTPPIADTTSFDDMLYAGDLYLYTINNVAAIGTGDSSIYIQVYAWMEDVQLGTNTGTQLVITTESGELSRNEMKTGPIERLSSKLMKVSALLTAVPAFTPYAAATTMGLALVNGISSIFGWSKPVLAREIASVRLDTIGNMALTIGNDLSQRLVLDPLQELNVDAECVGVQKDEMVIAEIASRRTYLKTFTWAQSDSAMSSVLFASAVTPNLVTDVTDSKIQINQPTAMAFAVLPFEFWRGDIIFRFEIVASNFHRGKIAVLFEPNLAQFSSIGLNFKINKQFIRVVDIQDTNTFELRVNWASYRSWLLVGPASTAYQNTDILLTNHGNRYCNGAITVVPFTKLQSPDTSSVKVNVYVYSDNLQVNCLTGANLYSERKKITAPGIVEITPESAIISSNTTVEVTQLDLNPSTASPQYICQEHFGEQPLSFRALMKRWVTSRTIVGNITATTTSTSILQLSIYPPSMLPYGGTGTPITELFSYLRYAYLGVKGGYRLNFGNSAQLGCVSSSIANPHKISLVQAGSSFSDAVSTDSTTYNKSYLEGTCTVSSQTATNYMVECPFYSNNLFAIACSDTFDDALPTLDMMESVWFRGVKYVFPPANTSAAFRIYVDSSAGEDFGFLRFLGAPYYTVTTA